MGSVSVVLVLLLAQTLSATAPATTAEFPVSPSDEPATTAALPAAAPVTATVPPPAALAPPPRADSSVVSPAVPARLPPAGDRVAPLQHPCATRALGASDCPNPWDRKLLLELTQGVGTPVGVLGLMVTVSPVRYLNLSGGVGAGMAGPQVAGHLRLRVPLPGRSQRFAIGAGVGISHGKYQEPSFLGCCTGVSRVETWTNVDVGFEARLENGLNFRGYIGRGVYGDISSSNDIPYLGTAVGYALLD